MALRNAYDVFLLSKKTNDCNLFKNKIVPKSPIAHPTPVNIKTDLNFEENISKMRH